MAHRSILCSVDFSEHSRDALRWAGLFAAPDRARVVALTVIDPLLAEAARSHYRRDPVADTESALREFVEASWPAGSDAPPDIALEVRVGDPAGLVVETATAVGARLIVIGTQGIGGVKKWILGSTTERVLRRTAVPVLAIPPGGKAPAVSRILAATDFSQPAAAAIATAVRLAGQFSAALALAHVVDAVAVRAEWRDAATWAEEARTVEARTRLERLAAEACGARGCDTVVAVGRPADVLGTLAEERGADLIVAGLGGGPGGPRPGSIAYRILSSASVPVLVVPAE